MVRTLRRLVAGLSVTCFLLAACDAATAGRSDSDTAVLKLITNSIGMKLSYVAPGEFLMGSIETPEVLSERYGARIFAYEGEGPGHFVDITEGFWLGQTEVTRGQFQRFVAETGYRTLAEREKVGGGVDEKGWRWIEGLYWDKPGIPQTDAHPVVQVAWEDAAAFCKWLTTKERRRYDLPTEAQWEYACRAGTETAYSWGDDPAEGRFYANMLDDAADRWLKPLTGGVDDRCPYDDGYAATAPVGRFRPNPWGFYDLHGNASEWCRDWYAKDYYSTSPGFDPSGPPSGVRRSMRGGSWVRHSRLCRSASRDSISYRFRSVARGFRVILQASAD
jgi:sulfatase modifying factor 1